MSRRTSLAIAASAALILGTAACGNDSTKSAPSLTSVTPVSSSSSNSPSSSTSNGSSTSSSSTSGSSTSTSTNSANGSGTQGGSTTIKNVSVDSSWHVENTSTDGCDMGMGGEVSAYQSPYSKNPKTFTCGSTAAALIACTLDNAGYATCIQGYESRMAARFPTKVTNSSIKASTSDEPTPLAVTLANGQTCNAMSHDQAQHYDNRSSWLWCGDNGVLLLPKGDDGTGSYFSKNGNSWTAQYSVNDAAPTTVGVSEVVYAA